jgi:signal transduction histidine kinase
MPEKVTRILVVEDSELDYELLLATLKRDGFTVESTRVEDAAAMTSALAAQPWDAVISDHNLPRFNSLEALATLKASGLDLPFLVVSGEPGEEIAVESVLAGADDYIMKNRLRRLAPALKRSMLAAETRREKRRAEADLQLSEERLRELTLHLVNVKEMEWAATAREIHDDIGGSLTAIKFDLAWLRQRIAEPKMAQRIDDAAAVTESALHASQRIMLNLRPGILDDGLVAALEWLARSFGERTGIACRFTSNRDALNCPTAICMVVYRVCQEALTNITRHAHANAVEVELFLDRSELTLEVSDDGTGIRPEDLRKASSFGILGMSERARGVGGWVEVNGQPGHGTTVVVSVPLPRGMDGGKEQA